MSSITVIIHFNRQIFKQIEKFGGCDGYYRRSRQASIRASIRRLEEAMDIKKKENLYANTIKDLLMKLGRKGLFQKRCREEEREDFSDVEEEMEDFTCDEFP